MTPQTKPWDTSASEIRNRIDIDGIGEIEISECVKRACLAHAEAVTKEKDSYAERLDKVCFSLGEQSKLIEVLAAQVKGLTKERDGFAKANSDASREMSDTLLRLTQAKELVKDYEFIRSEAVRMEEERDSALARGDLAQLESIRKDNSDSFMNQIGKFQSELSTLRATTVSRETVERALLYPDNPNEAFRILGEALKPSNDIGGGSPQTHNKPEGHPSMGPDSAGQASKSPPKLGCQSSAWPDVTFLHWIADRLIHVYGESENVDFIRRLRSMAMHDFLNIQRQPVEPSEVVPGLPSDPEIVDYANEYNQMSTGDEDETARIGICLGAQWYRERAQAVLLHADAENKRLDQAVSKYATAARVIHLHLKEFCDESMSYDEMISDASRNASAEIQRLKTELSNAKRAAVGQEVAYEKIIEGMKQNEERNCGALEEAKSVIRDFQQEHAAENQRLRDRIKELKNERDEMQKYIDLVQRAGRV